MKTLTLFGEHPTMTLDTDKLRKDLLDYYGTAMNNGFPMAVIDLGKVERASDEDLVEMAEDAGLDLRKYLDE